MLYSNMYCWEPWKYHCICETMEPFYVYKIPSHYQENVKFITSFSLLTKKIRDFDIGNGSYFTLTILGKYNESKLYVYIEKNTKDIYELYEIIEKKGEAIKFKLEKDENILKEFEYNMFFDFINRLVKKKIDCNELKDKKFPIISTLLNMKDVYNKYLQKNNCEQGFQCENDYITEKSEDVFQQEVKEVFFDLLKDIRFNKRISAEYHGDNKKSKLH